MNIYSAIHKAADHFLAHPEDLSFMSIGIPGGCGTPGCALGWIASFLGYPACHYGYDRACEDMGLEASPHLYGLGDDAREYTFYRRMDDIGGHLWKDDPELCATTLRAYAERYHAPTTPDWNALATPDDNIREATP